MQAEENLIATGYIESIANGTAHGLFGPNSENMQTFDIIVGNGMHQIGNEVKWYRPDPNGDYPYEFSVMVFGDTHLSVYGVTKIEEGYKAMECVIYNQKMAVVGGFEQK